MTKTSIIKECTQIIENNCESDFECYGVSYYLSYNTKTEEIEFSRATTSPTGETYSDGGIDTKTTGRVIREWKATIEDYTNLAVMFANNPTEHLKYEYGEDVECIEFKGIYSSDDDWQPFPMRKEFKLDAYKGVLWLRNAHFNLSNLYNYAIQKDILTPKEARAFDKAYNKLSSSSVEFALQDELFEDDDYYKNRD